jgi:hypothetical protein
MMSRRANEAHSNVNAERIRCDEETFTTQASIIGARASYLRLNLEAELQRAGEALPWPFDLQALQREVRAAALRDRLAPLEWLAARLERLRYARRRLSFIYPATASDGTQTWYLIHGARTLAAVVAPTNAASKETARRAIDAAFRTECSAWLREAYEHADGMMIVLAWFRKHRAELERTLTPQQALARC